MINPVINIINRMLLRKHSDVQDFEIKVPELQLKQERRTKKIFDYVLLAIASISLIVGGIGMRPLMGFRQVGIDVYHDNTRQDIKPVVDDMIADKLQIITNDQVCGGGGGQ